jgi:large repetitive protein
MLVPQVNSVSPNSGDVTGGEEVTVTGQNFIGATAVAFGANTAISFIVVDAQHITVVAPSVPGLVTGVVDVRVTTPDGTSAIAGGDHFTYTSPTLSDVLNAVTAVGAQVAANTSALSGLTANVDQIISDDLASAAALVALATSVGQIADVVLPVQATVTEVTPNSGNLGGVIVITGTGFTHTTGVFVGPGAGPVASFTVDSDTQITAVTLPDSPMSGQIVVITGNPQFVSSNVNPGIEFNLGGGLPPDLNPASQYDTEPAVIAGISPTAGPVAGGTEVTITGSGFGQPGVQGEVLFGGSVESPGFVVDTDGTIMTTVSPPVSEPGTVVVAVVPAGSFKSTFNPTIQFTYE